MQGATEDPTTRRFRARLIKNNKFGTVGEGSGRRRAAQILIAFNIERQSNTFRPSTLQTPDAIEFVLVSPPPRGVRGRARISVFLSESAILGNYFLLARTY